MLKRRKNLFSRCVEHLTALVVMGRPGSLSIHRRFHEDLKTMPISPSILKVTTIPVRAVSVYLEAYVSIYKVTYRPDASIQPNPAQSSD